MTVLVVGAGPVGLAMAVELARQGVPVRVVDKKSEVSPESRAAACHARTMEAFERMGIADRAIERGVELHAANIYSHGKEIVRLELADIDSPFPYILGLPQSETERLLAERLQELGISVEWETELTEFGQNRAALKNAAGETETLDYSYLIGCDGAHSTVREALGLGFAGGDYHQHFIWCDANLQWPLPMDEVAAFLDEHGGMFIAPITQSGRARVVFVFFDETHFDFASGKKPTEEDVNRLAAHFGPEGMTVNNPQWLTHFYVHHRIVTHYREGSTFLVGDSAHIHSPVGGQGMNTGIQDACNLAWKLAMVINGRADSSLLDSYNDERYPIGHSVVKGVDMATRMLTLTNPISQTIRDHLISFLSHLEPVRDRLIANLSETSVHYPESSICSEQGTFFSGGARAGDRAPDAQVGPMRLFQLFQSPRHQLLLFAGSETLSDLRDKYHYLKRRYSEWIDVHLITLSEQEIPDSLVDDGEAAHDKYGALDETLYLIRPDGYVGYRSQPADLDWFDEYIRDTLKISQKLHKS